MQATKIAWKSVKALAPTEVPIALATSLAPIPHAMKNPNTHPVISRKDPYSIMISIY